MGNIISNFVRGAGHTLFLTLGVSSLSWGQLIPIRTDIAFENPGFFNMAGAMAYDANRHRLAAADNGRDIVYIFDLTDRSFRTIEQDISAVSYTGLAFDNNGFLYIAREKNSVILKISPELGKIDSLDLSLIVPENFQPGRMAVANNGDIFTIDTEARIVYQFNNANKLVRKISEKLRRPDGIFIRQSGEILISDKGVYPLLRFSSTGDYSGVLSRPEDPTSQLSYSASGLAADQRGWLYTLNITSNRVLRFDPTGVIRTEWTPEAPFFPKDIAIDKFDNIYISESGTGRIVVYRGKD
jgi:sugar lactone lactonase YvrE